MFAIKDKTYSMYLASIHVSSNGSISYGIVAQEDASMKFKTYDEAEKYLKSIDEIPDYWKIIELASD